MRDEVRQDAILRLLADLKAIADLPPDGFQASQNEFSTLSDTLCTLTKCPSLPGLNGPKVVWVGNTMRVT